MTDEEIDRFYRRVEVLGLRRTAVPTVWLAPDHETLINVLDRSELRELTVEQAELHLQDIRNRLS